MANRYWVSGGTGSWDSTSNWAASSGGASGASVPSLFGTDNVFFDANSSASPITVTIPASYVATCLNLDFTGLAANITFNLLSSTAELQVSGNLTLANTKSFNFNANGKFNLVGFGTITSNGSTLYSSPLEIGSGASYTLADAFVSTSSGSSINVYGSLTTNGYALSAPSVTVKSTGSLSLGASSVNISVGFNVETGFVLNAGTSTVNFTTSANSAIGILNAGTSATFYNVTIATQKAGATTFNGAATVNNLTIYGATASTTLYTNYVYLGASVTVNGTLTLLSASANPVDRINIASNVIGTAQTLSVNTLASGTSNYDFYGINVTGFASPISGTSFGNRGLNSGITFTAAKTVYWVGGSGTSQNTVWATSSGGVAAQANFPLPQDTIVFDDNSGGAGISVGLRSGWTNANNNTLWVSGFDSSLRTLAMTTDGGLSFCGGSSFAASIATSVTGSVATYNANTYTFTNVSAVGSLFIYGGSAVSLQSALVCNAGLTVTNGTLTTNNYSVSILVGVNVGFTGTVGALNLGSSTLTIAGSGTTVDSFTGGYLACDTQTTFSITGTGTISFTNTNASRSKTCYIRGACSAITINQGGAPRLYIYQTMAALNDVTNTYASTGATNVTFVPTFGTALFMNNFSLSGSAGKLCTLTTTSSLTRLNLQKQSGIWYVGANSINSVNNSGLDFSAGGSADYLTISRINGTTLSNGFAML